VAVIWLHSVASAGWIARTMFVITVRIMSAAN
jgi:hypothetical protein